MKMTTIKFIIPLLINLNSSLQSQTTNTDNADSKVISAFLASAETIDIDHILIAANDFQIEGSGFYQHKGWLAINPEKQKSASAQTYFTYQEGKYDLIFSSVGEHDGQSVYELSINDEKVMNFRAPLSKFSYEEGVDYLYLINNIYMKQGDLLKVTATVGTDGKEFSRARWGGIILVRAGKGKQLIKKLKDKGTAEILIK